MHYTILEHVGAGGMGRVYRAEQAVLGKTLAVKVIHPHLANDENAAARFYGEAKACSRLNHPNSVSVIDFGRTDDNLLFLVMEFLRGRDLSTVVWGAGTLPVLRAVNIVRQVLAALSEAHEHGIVHRDIKPENILVEPLSTGGDFVKVVDFGLAKIRSEATTGVTSPGLVCGTPDYMAPEQCRGLPADHRSDLYSVAVMLYYCVTSRLPFEGEHPNQVLQMHVNDPPPDPRTHVPDLPEAFVQALLRGLAKEPADRYQSAVEFADALGASVVVPQVPSDGARGAVCPACRAPVPVGRRFCGECGTRVLTTLTLREDGADATRRAPQRPGMASAGGFLPFVGRDAELSQVELARARAADGTLVSLRVVGEEGSGKHRLVQTALESARRAGDLVVCVGPDPRWAGVAYAPVAQCIRALLEIPVATEPVAWLEERVRTTGGDMDPAVRAGFIEVFTPGGASDLDARGRTEGVVRALAWAMREGMRGRARAVVVAFEQLHRTDAASVRVLAGLLSRPVPVPAFVLMTHVPRFTATWTRCDAVALRGLAPELARQAVATVRAGVELPSGEVLPLHLEQLARWAVEGGGAPPSRLVDLIAARLERLPVTARRVVQALAVLGDEDREGVGAVAGTGKDVDAGALRSLVDGGWVLTETTGSRTRLRVAHPLLREVADAGIPADVRKDLHAACVQAARGAELPLEVQAHHAFYAGPAFQALLLIERVGDQALARGDDAAAAQALRRGLEFARRERGRGEIDEPERAVVIFTRKLGEALVRAGDTAEAEGVLREGLGVAARTDPEWPRLEGALGRALCARGRHGEGMRAIDNAVAMARRQGQRGVAAELLVGRAEMEALARAWTEVVGSLDAADGLLREALRTAGPSDPLRRQRVDLLLRLARARRLSGHEADGELAEARVLATEMFMVTARAQCDAEAAEWAESVGDRRAAVAAWRRAVHAAREAGDAALEALYEERARRLGRYEPVGATGN